jgi:vesicle transport through interaction with t-SNAREs protein 1
VCLRLVVVENRVTSQRVVKLNNLHSFYQKVSQMQIEIQGIPKSLKSQYQSLLKSSEASLSLFKKLSKEMHTKISHSDLLSLSHHHQFATSDDPYEDANKAVGW